MLWKLPRLWPPPHGEIGGDAIEESIASVLAVVARHRPVGPVLAASILGQGLTACEEGYDGSLSPGLPTGHLCSGSSHLRFLEPSSDPVIPLLVSVELLGLAFTA